MTHMWIYTWYCTRCRAICGGCLSMNPEPEDIFGCYHKEKGRCSGFIVTVNIPYRIWNADYEGGHQEFREWFRRNLKGLVVHR